MFAKVAILALIAVCVIAADDKVLTPPKPSCAYIEYDNEYKNYVMLNKDNNGKISGYLTSQDTKNHWTIVIRCDKPNDKGQCSYYTFYNNGTCQIEYMDGSQYYLDLQWQYGFLSEPFHYEKAENPVDCPVYKLSDSGRQLRGNITHNNCTKYINSTNGYVIADDQNRIVEIWSNGDYWISQPTDEIPTLDDFKIRKCVNGEEQGDYGDAPTVDVCKEDSGSDSSKSAASNIVASAVVLAVAALVALF